MQTKKLLRKILDELSASKEELRRLKRQINNMNDTIEHHFIASDASPEETKEEGILRQLNEVGGHPDISPPFEEPLEDG